MKLPSQFIDRNTISHMAVGEVAWTLPWAIMVDPEQNVWINGEYPAYPQSGGTVEMLIRRTAEGVEVLRGMKPQRPTRGVPWVGATEDDLLPVTDIL